MKGISSYYTNEGLIELSNNLLAVSSAISANPIVIVVPIKYTIVKAINYCLFITLCFKW